MSEFASLTKSEIFNLVTEVYLPPVLRRSKSRLLEEVERLPPDVKERLRAAAEAKREGCSLRGRRRKRSSGGENIGHRSVRLRSEGESAEGHAGDEEQGGDEELGARDTHHVPLTDDSSMSSFLDTPTLSCRQKCQQAFLDATNNDALHMETCGVCARRLFCLKAGMVWSKVSTLPGRMKLEPPLDHPSRRVPGALVSGLLLERRAVRGEGEDAVVLVCRGCLDTLSEGEGRMPSVALANNLWLGDTPWQLEALTFSEQQLVALLYPRVYIVKLYPKDQRARYEECSLQTALRGNVSTYALNPDKIADMVDGRLMPRRPAILANLISITFVGRGHLHKSHLQSTYRVRRRVVQEALYWLKAHNRYYNDVNVSDEALSALPEDDVPEELLSVVNQTDNVEILEHENDDYVPVYDADNNATSELQTYFVTLLLTCLF